MDTPVGCAGGGPPPLLHLRFDQTLTIRLSALHKAAADEALRPGGETVPFGAHQGLATWEANSLFEDAPLPSVLRFGRQ